MSNPVAVRRTASRGDTGAKLNDRIYVWCPGCGADGEGGLHSFELVTEGSTETGPTWSFNGDMEAPTFEPSYLTWTGDQATGPRCHSFLRGGVWEFLGDCTLHDLRGSHPMIPVPDWVVREGKP